MTVTTANMSTTAVMKGNTPNRNSIDNSPIIITTNTTTTTNTTNTTTTKTTTTAATTPTTPARSSTPKKSLLPASVRTCPYCRHLGSAAHIARCAQKEVQCSFCGAFMPASQISAHTTYTCEERQTIVACVGCGVKMPRVEMMEHLRTSCSGSQFRCEQCQQLFLTPAEYAMHSTTIITGCPLAVKSQKEEEKEEEKEKEKEKEEKKKKQQEQLPQKEEKQKSQKQPLKKQKQKLSESTLLNGDGNEHAAPKVKRRGTTASATSIPTPKPIHTDNNMMTAAPSTPEARPCTEEVVDVQLKDSNNNTISPSKQEMDNSASHAQESHPCPILTEEDCLPKTVARISENRGGSPPRHPSKFMQVKEKSPYNAAAAYKEMELNGSNSAHTPMRERQSQGREATHNSRERNRTNAGHSMCSMPVTSLHKQSRDFLKELQERREMLHNSKQRYCNIVSAAAPRLATAELQAKRNQQQQQQKQQQQQEEKEKEKEEGDLGLRYRTIRTSHGAAPNGLMPRYKSCPPDRRRCTTPAPGDSHNKNHLIHLNSDTSANGCRVLLTVTPAQETKAAEGERHNSTHRPSRQIMRRTSPFGAVAVVVGSDGRRSGSCRRMPPESTNRTIMSFDKLKAERERLGLMRKKTEEKKLHTCHNTSSNHHNTSSNHHNTSSNHHDSHKHCNGQNGVSSNSATLSTVYNNQRLMSSSQPAEPVIARRKEKTSTPFSEVNGKSTNDVLIKWV